DAAPAVAVVAVNVGFERTTLAVSDGLVCEFTRVLRGGGTKLAAALEHELAGRPGEARERLFELSLEPDESDALRPDEPEARAREAARHELHGLARELVTSLEYYQSQPESLPISEILIAGGTRRPPGFVPDLQRP